MCKKQINIDNASILIMGFTFKENCPDLRNTRVMDLVERFKEFRCNVDVYDPWIDKNKEIYKYVISSDEYQKNGYGKGF